MPSPLECAVQGIVKNFVRSTLLLTCVIAHLPTSGIAATRVVQTSRAVFTAPFGTSQADTEHRFLSCCLTSGKRCAGHDPELCAVHAVADLRHRGGQGGVQHQGPP